MTNGTCKVTIKFLKNINQEFFKVEYFISDNILETLLNSALLCDLCKNSKILDEFDEVINFEKSLIYVLLKFKGSVTYASCYIS